MADKVLFISGYSNTGKTTTTTNIIKFLSNNGYTEIYSLPTGQPSIDKICLFSGLDKTGNNIKIVINTAADNVASVNNFDSFLSQNHCDIIITACQNVGNIRQSISDTVQKYLSPNNSILELPLGKMTQRATNLINANNWYLTSVEKLVKHILKEAPYNLNI